MGDELAGLLASDLLSVARLLLGWRLRTSFGGEPTEVVLTEVEAYAGLDDPASHAFSGETKRNRSLFLAQGTLYVYLSYGIHWCMNVVIGDERAPNAVLLRGGEPVAGLETMVRRRGRADHVADGPGKLTQALGVSGEHDGTSLTNGPVRLFPGDRIDPVRIVATPRIGISKAVDWPWRFVLESTGE
ncbi:MAG: DNA-3-methyladenine glycosylase [Acidimicrobiia bacterium]|nr:MAG: DNA-3-methyladenine glycosylase [Acidimicrobiia bacterium]